MRVDVRACQAPDSRVGPEDGAPERMSRPERVEEELADEVVRRVLDHLDLLENDAALHLHVVVGEAGMKNQVGEKVERHVDLLVQDVCVEGGVLLAGERVDVPAEKIDEERDLRGRSGLGALEHEMLEKVGCPAVLFRLRGRPAAQVVPERD